MPLVFTVISSVQVTKLSYLFGIRFSLSGRIARDSVGGEDGTVASPSADSIVAGVSVFTFSPSSVSFLGSSPKPLKYRLT